MPIRRQRKPRRVFDEKTIIDAVTAVAQGFSLKQVSEDTGVHVSTLGGWAKKCGFNISRRRNWDEIAKKIKVERTTILK